MLEKVMKWMEQRRVSAEDKQMGSAFYFSFLPSRCQRQNRSRVGGRETEISNIFMGVIRLKRGLKQAWERHVGSRWEGRICGPEQGSS